MMTLKLKGSVLALGLTMIAQAALALTPDEVIADFQAQGFTRVEVKVGPTQLKVEGIRGTEKVEAIYESATGILLKTEVETVGAGENTAPGVSVRERSKDFVRVVRRSADATSGTAGGSTDDNGGDRPRGSNDDDGDDDDRSGRGSDDDDGDDDHGGRGGDDDDHGDDDHGHDDDHDNDDDDDDDDDDRGGSDDDGDDN